MTIVEYLRLLDQYPSLIHTPPDAIYHVVTDLRTIRYWQKDHLRFLRKRNLPLTWGEIGVLVDDPFVYVLRDLVHHVPRDKFFGYIRIVPKAFLAQGTGVVVFPWYQDRIVLLKHFRHPTRRWHYEFPRGFGEPHLSPEENARKEVEEEIGGRIGKLVDLGEMFSNTGLESDPVRLFFARIEKMEQRDEHVEGIQRVEYISLDTFEEWIKQGRIDDGFTITAYARARLRGLLDGLSSKEV